MGRIGKRHKDGKVFRYSKAQGLIAVLVYLTCMKLALNAWLCVL